MGYEGLLSRLYLNRSSDLNSNNDNLGNSKYENSLYEYSDGRIAQLAGIFSMKTYNNLWQSLCSYANLDLAFQKARRRKTKKPYVQEFEQNLKSNLRQLQLELFLHTYKPMPLQTFILRDPKTRKISKADFRDRVIHHALCNIIEPIFDKSFIHDSYANRKGKGALKAVQRFDRFKRKIYNKQTQRGYVLKADIKHYFEEIDHKVLLNIVRKKITDEKVLWLIKTIITSFGVGGADEVFPWEILPRSSSPTSTSMNWTSLSSMT